MRRRSLLAAILLPLALAGCQSTTISTGLPAQRGPVRQATVMGYASGLIMPGTYRLARRCPAGIAYLRTEQTPRDFAVQTVTAGILSPRTVTVICADAERSGRPAHRFVPHRVAPAVEERRGAGAEFLDLHRGGDFPRHRHRGRH